MKDKLAKAIKKKNMKNPMDESAKHEAGKNDLKEDMAEPNHSTALQEDVINEDVRQAHEAIMEKKPKQAGNILVKSAKEEGVNRNLEMIDNIVKGIDPETRKMLLKKVFKGKRGK